MCVQPPVYISAHGLQSMKSLHAYYITCFPNGPRRHMATVISLVIKVIEFWSITVGIV